MADCNELLQLIKQASIDAVKSTNPSGIYFGTVVSASPIKIKIDSKLILGAAQLVLTRSVTDYDCKIEIDDVEKNVKIHNGLVAGDSVILVRVQGGQKYIVMDKVG